ncbi:MAG: Pyrrolo-quinoline quinone repeat-containing protein [Chthoniobacteraceae bacterium]|nr:Pyrrolo-quinoline quinone repeat-containing protein [Chthoniobacteraceae bacterium]
MKRLPIALTLLILSATLLRAGDSWTQFRGPTAQGYSDAKGLPRHWSETENVKWKTALPGEGWSSPVVANGQIWMTTALEEGKSLRALCVDFATGKLVHDIEVFKNESVPPKHRRNSYASPTPVIDGDRVYLHFGSLGTACLSTKDGSKIWENRELKVDFQNGAGGSPVLFKDKLLIACDGMDCQFEAALDTATGKIAWKTERSAIPKLQKRPEDMRKAYGTPFITTIDGQPQSITTAAERLYAYDPATGKELWFVDYPGFSNVPLPVTDGKVMVIPTGFMKPEMWGIKVGGAKGDATSTHILWKQVAGAPAQASPVLVDGRLYMVNDSGILSCLNAMTGAIVWKERVGSDFAASLTYADGVIYLFDCMGKSLVIEPGDTFKTVASNQLADGFMASPAVVGKSLILRTKKNLYRIE